MISMLNQIESLFVPASVLEDAVQIFDTRITQISTQLTIR